MEVLGECGSPETQRWIATHAGPLLPERARNADHISRLRAVLVQRRSRTSMATTPSRGDTSKWILGQCVSPSSAATVATRPYTHRKSLSRPSTSVRKETPRAWRDHLYGGACLGKGRVGEIDGEGC
jgi:hypothetical protein